VSSEYWSCQFCSEFICALVQGSTVFSNNLDRLWNSRFQRGEVKQVSFLGPHSSGVTSEHQGYLVLSASVCELICVFVCRGKPAIIMPKTLAVTVQNVDIWTTRHPGFVPLCTWPFLLLS
jgi:hypothetical protein